MNDNQKSVLCLSGMPASGKDSVSSRLCELDNKFVWFRKHRGVDGEPKEGYFNITVSQFEEKIKRGDFVQWHGRYGRYYGVDREELRLLLHQGKIPIIHIGRVDNFYSFRDGLMADAADVRIVHVQLWESRECLKERIAKRDKTPEEINKRLVAMEQEFCDAESVMRGERVPFDIIIRNADLEETCHEIREIMAGEGVVDNGYDEFRKYLYGYNGRA